MLHRAREYDARRSPLRAALEAHLLGAQRRGRRHRPRRAPAAGGEPGLGGQRDHQPASVHDHRLAPVRRGGEPRRQRAAPRSGRRLRADGLPQPRSPAPGGRGARRTRGRSADSRRAQGRRKRAAGRAAQSRSRAAAHVGYHLVGKGRAGLEIDLAYRPKPEQRVRRWLRRHATLSYLGIDRGGHRGADRAGAAGRSWLRSRDGAALPPAACCSRPRCCSFRSASSRSRSSSATVDLFVRPERLPRLELLGGVPEDARTMVVIPTLITTRRRRRAPDRAPRGGRDRQSRSAHPLRDPQRLRRRRGAGRARRRRAARRGPRRHHAAQRAHGRRRPGPQFLLLHRKRLWNEREQVWMGWERKRGKLEEFNRLLRGATDTSFTTHGRPDRRAGGDPLRHHARFRYAAAARHRARADRHHASPAEPAGGRIRSCGASPKATASCSRASA